MELKIKHFVFVLLSSSAIATIPLQESDTKVDFFAKVIGNLLEKYLNLENVGIMSSSHSKYHDRFHNDIIEKLLRELDSYTTICYVKTRTSPMRRRYIVVLLMEDYFSLG